MTNQSGSLQLEHFVEIYKQPIYSQINLGLCILNIKIEHSVTYLVHTHQLHPLLALIKELICIASQIWYLGGSKIHSDVKDVRQWYNAKFGWLKNFCGVVPLEKMLSWLQMKAAHCSQRAYFCVEKQQLAHRENIVHKCKTI